MLVPNNLAPSKQGAPVRQATRFRARFGFMTRTPSQKLSRPVGQGLLGTNQREEVFQERAGIRFPPRCGALLFTVGLVTLLFTVELIALPFTVGLVALPFWSPTDAGAGFQPPACRRRLPEVGRRVTRVYFAHHTKINAPGSVEPAWIAQMQDVSRVQPTACGCCYHGPGRGPQLAQHSRQRGPPNLEQGSLD